jgi:hypothetical protein
MPITDFAQEVNEALIAVARLGGKARDGAANVPVVERCIGLDRAGEKALAERAERNHANAERLQRRNDLVFLLARPERVFALQRRFRPSFLLSKYASY